VPSIEERKKFCLSSSFLDFMVKIATNPIIKETRIGRSNESIMREVDALLYCKDPSSNKEK
jgi:hypothetical protein